MSTFTMKLTAIGVAICVAPILRADSSLDIPKTDEVAKSAEMRGDLERIHDNYLLAISYYQKALRVTPRNANLLNKLGISELKLGERGAARKHFSQALKVDPKNISALNNLGAVDFLDKKYKTAVKYLKQALELD